MEFINNFIADLSDQLSSMSFGYFVKAYLTYIALCFVIKLAFAVKKERSEAIEKAYQDLTNTIHNETADRMFYAAVHAIDMTYPNPGVGRSLFIENMVDVYRKRGGVYE
ncbi:hypothetical protein EXA18_06345 [Vibrio cincinnatiensis]|uniref:hypothetical protein n=1 Tax=Vibrio cincinnatiensis TaxID=675 RepID=UPI001EDF806D|nr:hypothetical protein [Vibrio cincinnatiensis]MCG3743108.1 hypothetical protein [Vibrio cincinnatiensis]